MTRTMKDSGIEWIGQIPKDWEVVRMKSCIAKRDGGAWGEEANNSEGDCICLRIADFDYNKFRFSDSDNLTIRHYPLNVIEKLKLEKNDILIEKSGGGEKTPVGRTVLFDKTYTALYANFMDRLKCSNIVKPSYMQYIFVTFYKNEYTRNYIKQTTGIQNLDLTSMLSKELMPLPSTSEQQKIADFLDKKCSHIDSILEKTKASIDECKQLKQSVITQAVTKGIRPNRPMKDSGIEWIGQIPEDWKIAQLKRFLKSNNGSEIKQEVNNDDNEAIPVYGSGGVFKYTNEFMYSGEVVMFGRKGTLGKPLYVNDTFWTVDTMYYLNNFNGLIAKHTYYLLVAFDWIPFITQTALPSIVSSQIIAQHFPIPSLKEQQEIVSYLDEKCTEIDKLITKKEKLIEELETYKKSLIYEYVTGKKEVI